MPEICAWPSEEKSKSCHSYVWLVYTQTVPRHPQCSIEMLWVLLICFQMWLSVLTESCSFHLPLTAVSFGQPWWVSKGVVADCSWPEGLVCTKRGGVLCSSLYLVWALIERKEFCCKYQNLIFWGWGSEKGRGEQGERQERKKEHVTGEHFSLGWSVWALPLGNYAVSWLKESALEQDFKSKAEVLILLCRSWGSHDNMCLTVIFKSLRNGTSEVRGGTALPYEVPLLLKC